MSGIYWGLAGTLGAEGPEGVYGHQGAFRLLGGVGAIWACQGHQRDVRRCRGVRVYWGLAGTLGT